MENLIKYPRTYHFPWSPGCKNDDRMLDIDVFREWNHEVIISEKMDGENTSLYPSSLHVRSLDYEPHPSRSIIKSIHGSIAHNIPKGWRICCENLTAVHSIKYTNLKSYCNVINIWDGDTCLGWDDTVTFSSILGLETVPVIWRGLWPHDYPTLCELQLAEHIFVENKEGYVVRPSASFKFSDFNKVVGKYVRENHVQTDEHWMKKPIEFNGLDH